MCVFFCSQRWSTPFSLVGHPSRGGQEAAGDDVRGGAARSPLARDDAVLGSLREVARYRAPGGSCGDRQGAHRRAALAAAVGERHEVGPVTAKLCEMAM